MDDGEEIDPDEEEPDEEKIDPVLVERFARGNGTVFVGSGISLGAGLPNWTELTTPLKSDLGIDVNSNIDPLQVAELYEVKNGRSALIQYLKDRLGNARFHLTRTHELIVSLPVQRIYTTNFDTFLEQASQKRQLNRNVISNAHHIGLSDASTLSIVKLHGDLVDPASIVITARDFYSYFSRNPAVADLLKVELQTKTVLFVGYSFSDPNLGMILGNAVSQGGPTNPLIYTVQFQRKELATQAMHMRGIKLISLNAEPGTYAAEEKLERWLLRFRQLLINFDRRKQIFFDGKTFPQNLASFSGPKHSIKRERIDGRMRSALSSEFRVIVVKGEAGVGKSHITAEAALNRLQPNNRNFLSEVFERVIWIRATPTNGRKGTHTLEAIFHAIASQVDASLPAGETHRERPQKKIDAILQELRLLVVIEDLEDPRLSVTHGKLDHEAAGELERDFEAIKRWLESGPAYANPRSRIIVTSRTATIAGFLVEVTRLGEEDATNLISQHAHAIMLRRSFRELNDLNLKKILDFTLGNPLAIRLCLGLINGSGNIRLLDTEVASDSEKVNRSIESVLGILIKEIWDALDPDEKRIVEALVIFPIGEWIPVSLLIQAAGGAKVARFSKKVQICVKFGLLEYDAALEKFSMHRTTREVLVTQELVKVPQMDIAREQLACYLLKFLQRNDVIFREEIAERYWSALVRDEMVKVDNYWPTIEAIMHWKENDFMIVKFTLLLAHYMDSRFLNAQRLRFVEQSIAALKKHGARTKALLHIDALGWTYVEEGSNDKAKHNIKLGCALLRDIDYDLHALACAWRARIAASEGELGDAIVHISKANEYVSKCEEKYWIKARIDMIAGDIKVIEKKPDEAEKKYLDAELNQEMYGGELGYQTDWRIGLALLRKAELHKAELRKAELQIAELRNDLLQKVLVRKDQLQRPELQKYEPQEVELQKAKDELQKAEIRKAEGKKIYKQAINLARYRFTKLTENINVANGRLYGEYGLALISEQEQSTREAGWRLRRILKEIEARHGEKNVLLKLAASSYQGLTNRGQI